MLLLPTTMAYDNITDRLIFLTNHYPLSIVVWPSGTTLIISFRTTKLLYISPS